MKAFFFKLTFAALILAVISYLVFNKLDQEQQTGAWPWLLVFLYGVNLVLFQLFIRNRSKKVSSFANFFMLATFLKLILYLAVIVIYLLSNKTEAAPFLITFFVYYLVFTALEVSSVTSIQHKS
jgi:cytochrome bd-type quinol oxidase subunit 2